MRWGLKKCGRERCDRRTGRGVLGDGEEEQERAGRPREVSYLPTDRSLQVLTVHAVRPPQGGSRFVSPRFLDMSLANAPCTPWARRTLELVWSRQGRKDGIRCCGDG